MELPLPTFDPAMFCTQNPIILSLFELIGFVVHEIA